MPEIIGFLPVIMNFSRRFLFLKTDGVKKRWQNSDDLRQNPLDFRQFEVGYTERFKQFEPYRDGERREGLNLV